jgi:hypothetical protein
MSRVSRIYGGDSAALALHCVRKCHQPGEKHADESSTYLALDHTVGCNGSMGLF